MIRVQLAVIAFFISAGVFSQNINVTEFYLDELDITANQQGTIVLDQNGEKCALLKIITTEKGLTFDVGTLGVQKTEPHTSETWVYVPFGVKRITISHPLLGQLRDYIFPMPIQKARTYVMKLNTVMPTNPSAHKNGANASAQIIKAVDLGLSVNWASCNVGAKKPEEHGGYFAWGYTGTWDAYLQAYIDNTTFNRELTKYNAEDKKTQLEANDDVAHVIMGGGWRMPTAAELKELNDKCTWTWTIQNKVKGYKVTGPSGNYIFLPAAGYKRFKKYEGVGGLGYYWSSTLREHGYVGDAQKLSFSDDEHSIYFDIRKYGFSIRAVCAK